MRTLTVDEMDAVSGGVWVWPAVGAAAGALGELGEALEDGWIEGHEALEICGGALEGALGGGLASAVSKAAKKIAKAASKGKKKGG
jgi:hypothetical protein